MCPAFVRCISGVCPPYGESRTQRRTVRRTEGVAIVACDVINNYLFHPSWKALSSGQRREALFSHRICGSVATQQASF